MIRKRIQVDNLNELPRDKRPPDKLTFDSSPEELDDFLERVLYNKKAQEDAILVIRDDEIE